METVNHKLVEVAIAKVSGEDFEKFAQVMYSNLAGVNFIPTGGVKDGGADGFQDLGVIEGEKPGTFYQMTTQENHKQKIKYTVKRLIEFGREPKSLVYITSRPLNTPDKDEEELSAELGVFVKIRAREWIVSNINSSEKTVQAYNTYLSPYVAFINEIGGATFISNPKHLQSRTVCVFLSQEAERRCNNSTLLESITDSLILWALNDTDPDTDTFLSRKQLQENIESTFPTAKKIIRGALDNRLKVLSSKNNSTGRDIRRYRKEDKYCLTYETRLIVEQENIEDEYLKVCVLEEFEIISQTLIDEIDELILDASLVANVAISSIEKTFEETGLELASFLEDSDISDQCPPISDHIDSVILESKIKGDVAGYVREFSLTLIRKSFYESTENQRAYFGKLSRTYALLFSLNADPRIVEYFQSMSSKFRLLVGTDILVRSLSEHYLKVEDQMTCNMLQILQDAGSTLILTEPVLEELHRHLETTDWEFKNYYSEQEPYIDINIARHANKILIRSYFYAKLKPVSGVNYPKGWKAHIGQFCDYDALHSSLKGKQQLKEYLVHRFGFEYYDNNDLKKFANDDDVEALSEILKPFKKDTGQDVLAVNDARLILSVYGMRKSGKENHTANPYGYSTWWLTQETLVQKATWKLIRDNNSKYIIRPDFILNYISLSPSMSDVRNTHRNVMPTLLGVKLSNRMRDDVFHDIMTKFKTVADVDDSRAKVIMGNLSNDLKGDSFKQYEVKWNSSGSQFNS